MTYKAIILALVTYKAIILALVTLVLGEFFFLGSRKLLLFYRHIDYEHSYTLLGLWNGTMLDATSAFRN